VVVHLNDEGWRQLTWKADEYGQNDFTINLRDPDFTTQVQRIAVIVVSGNVVALSLGRSGDLDTGVKFANIHVLQPAVLAAIIRWRQYSCRTSASSAGRTPPPPGPGVPEGLH
jgi:hypothetical protein